jgi:hypothetical protein
MFTRTSRRAALAAAGITLLSVGIAPTLTATPRCEAPQRHEIDRARDERRPPIHHVFVIVLENEGFDTTFGPQSKAPYLSKTLTSQGVLLNQYYGTGHASLDNYIAMISGQAATPDTRNDCQTYGDFEQKGLTADGQAIGHGCVYPDSIKTLADQLDDVVSRRRPHVVGCRNGGSTHVFSAAASHGRDVKKSKRQPAETSRRSCREHGLVRAPQTHRETGRTDTSGTP